MSQWIAPTYQTAHGLSDNPSVECGCGRTTNADMMLDVRALSGQVTSVLRAAGIGGDYICDGCRARIFALGIVSRLDLYTALGAPADVLSRITAR